MIELWNSIRNYQRHIKLSIFTQTFVFVLNRLMTILKWWTCMIMLIPLNPAFLEIFDQTWYFVYGRLDFLFMQKKRDHFCSINDI